MLFRFQYNCLLQHLRGRGNNDRVLQISRALDQLSRFSSFAAHWNPLGSFKKY